MRCELFYNKSDQRYIRKELEAIYPVGSQNPYFDIEIIEDSSVENPTLILSHETNVMQANYMFIPDLGRFYYIEEKTMSNGRLFIKAKVDVLMSFAEEILNTMVVLERSEDKFNLYLPDNLLPLETPSNVRTIDFPSGFQENSEFILILAGSEE